MVCGSESCPTRNESSRHSKLFERLEKKLFERMLASSCWTRAFKMATSAGAVVGLAASFYPYSSCSCETTCCKPDPYGLGRDLDEVSYDSSINRHLAQKKRAAYCMPPGVLFYELLFKHLPARLHIGVGHRQPTLLWNFESAEAILSSVAVNNGPLSLQPRDALLALHRTKRC